MVKKMQNLIFIFSCLLLQAHSGPPMRGGGTRGCRPPETGAGTSFRVKLVGPQNSGGGDPSHHHHHQDGMGNTGLLPQYTVLENSCDTSKGFRLHQNLNYSSCIDGRWIPGPPSCKKLCPRLLDPTVDFRCENNYKEVNCNQWLEPGTKATGSCKRNHYPKTTSKTCLPNGIWPEKFTSCNPVCGTVKPGERSIKEKIGGHPLPWQGVLYSYNETRHLVPRCGGALITLHVFLTAAHCVHTEDLRQILDKNIMKVVFDQPFINSVAQEELYRQQVGRIRKVIVREGFHAKDGYFINDLALLDLSFDDPAYETLWSVAAWNQWPVCSDWGAIWPPLGDAEQILVPGWRDGGQEEEIFGFDFRKYTTPGNCEVLKGLAGQVTSDKFCAIQDDDWKKKQGQAWRLMNQPSNQLPKEFALARVNAILNYSITNPTYGTVQFFQATQVPGELRVLPGSVATVTRGPLEFAAGVLSNISGSPSHGSDLVFTDLRPHLADWPFLSSQEVLRKLHSDQSYDISNYKDCGEVKNFTGDFDNEVTFPWVALIYRSGEDVTFVRCEGSVISQHLILTSILCVKQRNSDELMDPREMRVAVGKRYLETDVPEASEQWLSVYRVIPRYIRTEANLLKESDVALIELANNIEFNDLVRPVCVDWSLDLVNPEEKDLAKPFNQYPVAWTSEKRFFDINAKIAFQPGLRTILPPEVCWKFLELFKSSLRREEYDPETTACAYRFFVQSFIQEGSGLTVIKDDRHYLFGVRNQVIYDFDIFSRVSEFIGWLKEHRLSIEYIRNYQGCGHVYENVELISFGQNATQVRHPWHVGLFYKTSEGNWEQQCGGTLIHPKIVLTAAHCLSKSVVKDPEDVMVVAGKVSRSWITKEPSEQRMKVQSIHLPSTYFGSAGQFKDDIALINLKESANITNSVLPACIPTTKENIAVGSKGSVVGWGLNENKEPSEILQVTTVPKIPKSDCLSRAADTFRPYISRDKFCTNYINDEYGRQVLHYNELIKHFHGLPNGELLVTENGLHCFVTTTIGSGPQKGDSGGGLTVPVSNRHFVFGVVSVKPPFDETWGAFTDVIFHFDWIRETTENLIIS